MSRVRAVFFDLDNTLWDVHPVIVRAEHAMFDFLRARYPAVTGRHDLDSMRALRVQVAREFPDKRHDFTWLRLEALRRHARDAGYADSMAQEAFEVFFRTRNEVVLYDDVRPTLESAGQGLPAVRHQQRQRGSRGDRPGAVLRGQSHGA